MKNCVDTPIFHTAICAGTSQISLDATIEIAFANFYCAIPLLRNGMESSVEVLIVGIVIGIIVLCGFLGHKEGIVRIVLSMVATIVSMIVTSIVHAPVYEFIKDRFGVMEKIERVIDKSLKDIKIEDISYIEEMQLPEVIKEKLMDGAKNIQIPIREYIVLSIASVALSAMVFIILYAIVSILIKVIIDMADIITKLPVISWANQGAGLVIGLIYGIFIVWIAMIVLTALSSVGVIGDVLIVIGDNEFLSFIYDSNPLTGLLSKAIETIK